jgi:simple sugar transport system substrate-binding protein
MRTEKPERRNCVSGEREVNWAGTMIKGGVSRRNFLKAGGAGIAGAALFGIAGCGGKQGGEAGGEGGGEASGRENIRLVVVLHAVAADPFWSVVENGDNQAAKDMGVKVDYQAPDKFDIVRMRQLLDGAVASRPDGLIVSIPDPNALGPSIKKAIDAGIPVIAVNSGLDSWKKLGALAYVGQAEYEAGVQAGERLAKEGVNKALCINQDVGNYVLEQRCAGFTKGLGGNVKSVAVDVTNPTDAQARIVNFLRQNQDVNGMIGLGSTAGEAALKAVDSAGRSDEITITTFDLSPTILQAINDGKMLFAVDQQQYLQGYLPVVLLTLYNQYGLVPNGVISTGPGFVTKDNAKQVISLSKKGIR